MTELHQPVMTREVLQGLAIREEGVYVDATYGRGGHCREILNLLGPGGRLIACDRDPEAEQDARQRFADEPRLHFERVAFSQLAARMDMMNLRRKIDGLLVDLGVSSPQLDTAERGFSFNQDGPLDMRMDPEQKLTAAAWINNAPAAEIADVLYHYGDERYSRRIAHAIVERRRQKPFTRTLDLATTISHCVPRRGSRIHPATRSFQAIRIHVNDELGELWDLLQALPDLLAPGARIVAIAFHSIEDRLVKRALLSFSRMQPAKVNIISRILRADRQEVLENPRARSARLRVAEVVS